MHYDNISSATKLQRYLLITNDLTIMIRKYQTPRQKVTLRGVVLIIPMLLLTLMSTTGCMQTLFNNATIGQNIDDNLIKSKISLELCSTEFKRLFTKVAVTVYGGDVLLTGSVENEEDRLLAEELAEKQNGVKTIFNEIQISDDSNHFDAKQYALDSYITSSIRTRMLTIKNVKSVNYTIVTYHNTVYVMGIARNKEELDDLLENIALVAGVQKVVNCTSLKSE